MSYNGKKNDKIEIDDLEIRSHLNTSLDLSGIRVSEDLIHRTLEAIQAQSEQQTDEEAEAKAEDTAKKFIPWNRYIRGFAGIAAAAVIVVAGYGLFGNSGFYAQRSTKNSADSAASENQEIYDTADAGNGTNYNSAMAAPEEKKVQSDERTKAKQDTESASKEETNASTADKSSASVQGEQDGMTEDTPLFSIQMDEDKGEDNEALAGTNPSAEADSKAETDNAGGSDSTSGLAGTAGSDKSSESTAAKDESGLTDSNTGKAALKATQPDKTARSFTAAIELTFQDIFPVDPSQASYLLITNETSGLSVTLTSQEDIADFYSLMDQHQFSNGTKGPALQNYMIEAESIQPDEVFYTMIIGEHITVEYQSKNDTSQSFYDSEDADLLSQNLQEFLDKYSEQ